MMNQTTAAKKIHRCKLHEYRHAYTVCPVCQSQYCDQHWAHGCPNKSWHPAHGKDAKDIGERFMNLQAVTNAPKGKG